MTWVDFSLGSMPGRTYKTSTVTTLAPKLSYVGRLQVYNGPEIRAQWLLPAAVILPVAWKPFCVTSTQQVGRHPEL